MFSFEIVAVDTRNSNWIRYYESLGILFKCEKDGDTKKEVTSKLKVNLKIEGERWTFYKWTYYKTSP